MFSSQSPKNTLFKHCEIGDRGTDNVTYTKEGLQFSYRNLRFIVPSFIGEEFKMKLPINSELNTYFNTLRIGQSIYLENIIYNTILAGVNKLIEGRVDCIIPEVTPTGIEKVLQIPAQENKESYIDTLMCLVDSLLDKSNIEKALESPVYKGRDAELKVTIITTPVIEAEITKYVLPKHWRITNTKNEKWQDTCVVIVHIETIDINPLDIGLCITKHKYSIDSNHCFLDYLETSCGMLSPVAAKLTIDQNKLLDSH